MSDNYPDWFRIEMSKRQMDAIVSMPSMAVATSTTPNGFTSHEEYMRAQQQRYYMQREAARYIPDRLVSDGVKEPPKKEPEDYREVQVQKEIKVKLAE